MAQDTTEYDATREGEKSLKDVIRVVEESVEFQGFSQINPTHYLVHAFAMTTIENGVARPTPVELGYYGKDTDKITVFKTYPIRMLPEEQAFKEKGTIPQLTITDKTMPIMEAIITAERHRAALYPRHLSMKAICILQQKETPVWNITIVTHSLQMANFRIDAESGALISNDLQSLMNLSAE